MKPLILWLLAICALTLTVATCGDSDDDDSSDPSTADDDDTVDDDSDDDADDDIDDDASDDDTQTECDVWTDATSGLTWTVDPATTNPLMNWPDAVDFCEALVCIGYDDWRP